MRTSANPNRVGTPIARQHAAYTTAFGTHQDALLSMMVEEGLGLLTGSSCPHYNGETKRRPAYKKLILNGEADSGYAIDDGVGLHFINEKLFTAVSSRKKANAFFVFSKDGMFYEDKLSVQYIKSA